jgi:hypothetical protein
VTLTIAGFDMVETTATISVFHILNNKQVLSVLMKELEGAWPDKDSKLSFHILEKLLYVEGFLT